MKCSICNKEDNFFYGEIDFFPFGKKELPSTIESNADIYCESLCFDCSKKIFEFVKTLRE